MGLALTRRRQLRRQPTAAEAILWSHLRGRQLAGFKFRRQHPCGPFILDFFCVRTRLAIEVEVDLEVDLGTDGAQPVGPGVRAYDAWRARYLAHRGVTVLRFPAEQVLRETPSVLIAIAAALLVDHA